MFRTKAATLKEQTNLPHLLIIRLISELTRGKREITVSLLMSIYINLRMRSSERSVDTHCGGGADWIMPLECNSVGTSKGIDSINALFRPLLFFQTLALHAFC